MTCEASEKETLYAGSTGRMGGTDRDGGGGLARFRFVSAKLLPAIFPARARDGWMERTVTLDITKE